MNSEKLKLAEENFLSLYPDGFADEGLAKITKRHRMDAMVELAQRTLGSGAESHVEQTVANLGKIVSRASMVSMFEKPKFRDFLARLDRNQKGAMVDAYCELLHGHQQQGFELLVELLKMEKLAKWSLVSIVPAYYSPLAEVFVKPTTAKGVIDYFEIAGLIYKPSPTWDFYSAYRDLINSMKLTVDPSLSPSNAAFSGFLMMSLPSNSGAQSKI